MAAGTEPSLEERVARLEATIGRLILTDDDFMSVVRTDIFRRTGVRGEAIRMTHLPTGVMIEADTRDEAVIRLKKAVAGHARRQHDPEQP